MSTSIEAAVREWYGRAARAASEGTGGGCCGGRIAGQVYSAFIRAAKPS